MDYLLFAEELLFAGLIGLLVGVEREFDRSRKKSIPLGARSFSLISIIGLLAGYSNLFYPLFIGLLSLLIISFFVRFKEFGERGLTTYLAALLVFISGLLIGFNEFIPGVIIGIITAGILSVSPEIHHFTELLTRNELKSTILFALISLVILPLLPNSSFLFFNPFRFWLLVVLISGLSFISYIALRVFSDGLPLVGFIGGFISSKMVLFNLVKYFNNDSKGVFNGVLLAVISSLITNFLIISFTTLNLELMFYLMPLFVFSGLIIIFFFKHDFVSHHKQLYPSNPFTLISALKLALIIFVITSVSSFFAGNASLLFSVIFFSSIASSVATSGGIASLFINNSISVLLCAKLFVFSSAIIVLVDLFIAKFLNKELFNMLLKPLLLLSLLFIGYFIIL